MEKSNSKIKKLVKSIGICSIIIALMLPTVIGGGPNGPWDFWSNRPHVFNTNTGNIGIGTSTPEEKLHISDGNIRVDNGAIQLVHSNGYKTFINSVSLNTFITDLASGSIVFSTGTSPGAAQSRFCIANNGNIGIGTLSPEEKLHVYGNIRVDGNVGIGTETPLGKLDVETDDDIAIIGVTSTGTGIYGFADADGTAIHAQNPGGGIAISGYSDGGLAGLFNGDVYVNGHVGIGILPSLGRLEVNANDDVAISGGTSSGSAGVYGYAGANGAAVHGQNPSGGIGVSGYSNGGYAGYFKGDTLIDGDLNLTGTIKGAIMTNIREVSNGPEYMVYYNDYTLFVNAEDVAINIILPQASQFEGRILVIKKVDNTINPMVITPYTGDLIDGFSSWSTVMPFEGVTLQSDGVSHWYIIGGY